MVANAATECTSISAAASDQKTRRARPRASSLVAQETMAPATAPYTANSATALAEREVGLRRPDFVLGERGREHRQRFEKCRDVLQRVSERLQPDLVDVELVVGRVAVVLDERLARGIEALMHERGDVLRIVAM